MRCTLRNDLTAAIKARDRVAISALRSALAAIENAEAPPVDQPSHAAEHENVAGSVLGVGASEVTPRHLTDSEVRAIVETEIAERTSAAAEYEEVGRSEPAERLRAEADILNRYLSPAG